MVHAEMCANWGYERLHKDFEKRAIEEMKHAEKLIARILFLEGSAIVSVLRRCHRRRCTSKIAGDHVLELGAVKAYNAAINQAGGQGLRHPTDARRHPPGRGPAHR